MKYLPLDTIRIVLVVALVILCIDLYGKWEEASAPAPLPPASPFDIPGMPVPGATTSGSTDASGGVESADSAAPAPAEKDAPDITIALPPVPVNQPRSGVPEATIDAPVAETRPSVGTGSTRPIIVVETDLARIGISPEGGQLVYAQMKKYPLTLEQPDNGYALLSPDSKIHQVVQSGFISRDNKAPNHHSLYRLGDGGVRYEDDGRLTVVPLRFDDESVRVLKEIHINHDSYIVRENYTISNTGAQALGARLYAQVNAAARIASQALIASYYGGGYYREEDGYRKLDYDTFADDPLQLDVKDGWLAMIEHYFITAMVPPTGQEWRYYSKTLSQSGQTRYLIGAYGPTISIPSGGREQLGFDYFIGPKHHDQLAVAHPELGQSIDYGVLSFLSKPLFWLLDFFHAWTANWGWSIILLTMVVRLILYKPAEISFRSMARMREATPEIQRIREQYKDNREQMGVQMMDVYKRRKINPLSGCLPILLQIPVFIALYWMLLESVELRQAPWILWIHDLSARDPYYVLPILMGGFMVVQQKLNPAPLDPVQQKVFAAMPIVLGGISLFFPAGLVLYWTVNNALSILQQWVINKRVHEQAQKQRD